jgi:pilus assembly protein CpaE
VSTIVLASPGPELLEQLGQGFGAADVDVRTIDIDAELDPERLVKELVLPNPDLVVLGPGMPQTAAVAIAGAFDRLRPEVAIVLVGERTPALLDRALRAGVRDVIAPDTPRGELVDAIDRALETAVRRRANVLAEREEGRGGRVVMVLSPKGGAGKTTIATNLAVGIGKRRPREVVLVDGDLQFGDVANALRLVPDRTIADAARAATVDATALKVFLTPHPTGVYAFCGPEEPGDADGVAPELMAQWVRMLAGEFPFVVVDTDAGLSEHTLAMAEVATDLVLVCATDVPSIRSMRKEMAALEVIGLADVNRILVLNRADARVGLSLDDIEATLECKADIAIPSSRTVPLAMNQGTPLLETSTASPAVGPLLELASRFVPEVAPVGRRRRGKGKHAR